MSDRAEWERQIAARLKAAECRLTPLDVSCANPVFRADLSDGRQAFFKVGDRETVRQAAARLTELTDSPYVPRVLIEPSADFEDGRALCLEWKACRKIEVVDMTDDQVDSLVDGMVSLSRVFQHATDVLPADGEDSPERQYDQVCDFARRHPLVAPFLRGLTSIPREAYSYEGRSLKIIHGDAHALNFGFADGRFAAMFDFDSLVWGLPCEDLAYALGEDMRRRAMGASRRARLLEIFARFRARAPWPTEEWLVAVNHVRLRIAANRLVRHPHNPLVAIDVLLRDRMVRPLVAACS